MTESTYQQLQISTSLAEQIAFEFFNIKGNASPLAGEIDFNFKITTTEKSYILKVVAPMWHSNT
jgi:Ser/Thr protein kinase RdoA (MazF antagonist)